MTHFLTSLAPLFVVAAANAATFTVTNTNDSGTGSLREAIAQANAAAGADTIDFGVTGTITLTTGQIAIKGPLTIVGPGANNLTIDANANSRVFSITATSPDCPALDGSDYLVSISGLRLTNGRRTASNAGGAIYAEHSLALDSVVIDHSTASKGGGVAFDIQYPGQSLTISNAQFLDNIVEPLSVSPGHSHGGALNFGEKCATAPSTPATVTIANSLFSGNRAQPTGALKGHGGAIYGFSRADVTITDTRIVDNHVNAPNPPVVGQTYRGGGIYGTANSLTIERSEISGNTTTDATFGGVTRGGAIGVYNDASDRQAPASAMTLSLINSTISGNTDAAYGGALWVYGNVAVNLDNSTLSNNIAPSGGSGGIVITTGATTPESAGNATAPTLTLASTILANNANTDVGTGSIIPAFTINATRSLIRVICSTCNISVIGAANLGSVDPLLGALAINGGLTRTHALLPGSPAINAGSNSLNLATDQRGAGFPRVVSGTADIGAFEYNPVSTGSAYARNYVQKAYVAYYGRPADPGGLTYWATRMDAEGGSLNAIIGAFGYSDEFSRRYGGLSYAALVTRIYQQTLGRDPDPAGLAYYVGELQAGRRTLQAITLDVMNGATTAPDSTVVANKLEVATYYTAKVEAGCAYGMEQDGVNALSGVTADPVMAAIAKVAIGRRCRP